MGSESQDDSVISDDELVYRRIPEQWWVPDHNIGRERPSSQAFIQDGPDGPVSVYVASRTIPSAVVSEGPEPYLVSVLVSVIREMGLDVVYDPMSGGPGHATIVGRKTHSCAKKLAKASKWIPPYTPQSHQ